MATKTRKTKKIKVPKVNAGYRLPLALVVQIREQAGKENVQPCRVAERWLLHGSKQDRAVESQNPDDATSPESK